MQICGHWLVKAARKLLFFQKCPQSSQKLSASQFSGLKNVRKFTYIMQTCGHWLVNPARKLLFFQKCPQSSQKLSASNACMLATFSMSVHFEAGFIFKVFVNFGQWIFKVGFLFGKSQRVLISLITMQWNA